MVYRIEQEDGTGNGTIVWDDVMGRDGCTYWGEKHIEIGLYCSTMSKVSCDSNGHQLLNNSTCTW